MIGIQVDEDELLIDGTIKCESERGLLYDTDELYRIEGRKSKNENVD